ncbi:MAG TPA: S9 family peptidase [Bacteroidota bacterium]|nr:S9 family peptidase [Bacteroidota bacterium]
MHVRRSSILLLLLHLALLAPLAAQSSVLDTRNLFDIRQAVETAVSPDGRHVAYTVFAPRPFTDAAGPDYRELHVYDVQAGASRMYLGPKRALYSLSWSPDGSIMYFMALLDGSGPAQVHRMRLDGGEPEAVTRSATGISDYALSPDGRGIAYIATTPGDAAVTEWKRKGFDAQVYEELNPHANVYVLTLGESVARQLTKDVSVFDIEWSPDGNTLAAAVAPMNTVDQSYMFKRIHLIDARSGVLTPLVDNPGKLGKLAFSPDGAKLAFISAVAVWDSKEGSVFVVDVRSPKPFAQLRNLHAGYEGTVVDIAWKDAGTLYFAAEEGVDIALREVDLNGKLLAAPIAPGTLVFSSFSVEKGLFAFAASTPQHPRELYLFDGAAPRRVTTLNPWLANVRLARQERFEYKAKDGLRITGVLIYPLDYKQGTRYPLIVDIHGGPESAYQNGWVTNYGNWGQVAAARGFAVFMPNYRASTGRGVEYAKMGLGDLAGKEFTDVLDGIDRLDDMGLIDPKRVGIGGGSYGGYFASWGATRHSKRFAAAVSFVGVSNQISKRNTTDIPWEDYHVHWGIWTHEDFAKVYDRSPVKWAQGSTTPTLILHGTEDPRVHPSQSLELYRALKMHGKAPVRLVWYPGEGHGNRRNTSRLDYLVRTMDWFETYLKGSGKEMPPALPDYPVGK